MGSRHIRPADQPQQPRRGLSVTVECMQVGLRCCNRPGSREEQAQRELLARWLAAPRFRWPWQNPVVSIDRLLALLLLNVNADQNEAEHGCVRRPTLSEAIGLLS